jgi:hypothetical protein
MAGPAKKRVRIAERVAEPNPSSSDESDDEQEPEQEPEEEEEEDDTGADASAADERIRKIKRSRVNARRKAAQIGVRSFAIQAGSNAENEGTDAIKNIIGTSDVVRCAKWCPAVPSDSFLADREFENFLALRDEPLPKGAARTLLPYVESFARRLANEVVLRNLDDPYAPSTITSARVKACLRPYSKALGLSTAPLALVAASLDANRYVPGEGIDARLADAKKLGKAQSKKMRAVDREILNAKLERMRARDAKAAEKRLESVPSVTDEA